MNTEQKKSRMALKIILPILILLLGIGAFVGIGKLKKPPQRQTSQQLGILVDVIELQAAPHQVTVHATGTVQTEQEIALVPEVSGKVNWISPRLVGGGLFKKDETLLKIEQSDYLLSVEKARADIARARVALKTEQERAQANLQLASLNLQRTELKAPFNGRIRREQVDLGQYLRAGTSIGSFAGTDRAEIHIPLPTQELKWLTIPTAGSTQSAWPRSSPSSMIPINLPAQADCPTWQPDCLSILNCWGLGWTASSAFPVMPCATTSRSGSRMTITVCACGRLTSCAASSGNC